MVDHEIAHVFTTHKTATDKARKILEKMPGIAAVLNREEQKKFNIDHPNSGELVLMAEEGGWFAYPWWTSKKEAPDFAGHVDIHLKPGYDPCELFWGWPPSQISMNTEKIKGTHGRTGPGREVAWASSLNVSRPPANLPELSRQVMDHYNSA